MSEFDFDNLVNKVLLTKLFDYKTSRSLDSCIQTICALQPRFFWLAIFSMPGTLRTIGVSPQDDGAFFEIRTFYIFDSLDWLETASITGYVLSDPTTGKTRVRGQAQLNGLHMGLAAALIGFIIIAGLLLNAPEILYLFALGFIGFVGFRIYRSYRKLVKAVLAL